MANIVNALLGEYTIRYNLDGTIITGLAGLDYSYITRCGLLLLCVYGVIRIASSVVSGMMR